MKEEEEKEEEEEEPTANYIKYQSQFKKDYC